MIYFNVLYKNENKLAHWLKWIECVHVLGINSLGFFTLKKNQIRTKENNSKMRIQFPNPNNESTTMYTQIHKTMQTYCLFC